MAPRRSSRSSWETVEGPEVETTSAPRDEDRPGVPRPPEPQGQKPAHRPGEPEEREVAAADPALSEETNRRLTAELREVLGTDRVEVPADRRRTSRGEREQQEGPVAYLVKHRFVLTRNLAIVLTFGAIVALATGTWWLLPLAAGVHAIGTMTVTLTTIRATTVTERPSAEVAAAMSEEGVRNPDERFSRMVDEFRQEPEGRTGEVLAPGYNERTGEASRSADAGGEQSSAMTPTAQPSEPGGEGGAPDVLIWTTIASLLILSIVFPAASGGGWMWLLPAVMVPLLIGWVVMQRVMISRPTELRPQGRGPLVAIVLCTAAAVAVFCVVVAVAFHH